MISIILDIMMAEYTVSNEPSVSILGTSDTDKIGCHNKFKVTFLSDNKDIITALHQCSDSGLKQLCTAINLLIDAYPGCNLEMCFRYSTLYPQLWITDWNRITRIRTFMTPPNWEPLIFPNQHLVVMKIHATLTREFMFRNILLTLEEKVK